VPTKIKRKTPHSVRFTAQSAKVNADNFYTVEEAIALAKETASTKFVEGVDLSIKLGIDPRKSDQNVRGTTSLPHGTGKVKKVAVLAKGDAAKEAEQAGADTVGDEDLIKKIQDGFKDFDIIIAHDEMAPQIGKIGKALGPKTPNKRNGTVTSKVGDTVREIKAATRVEYRADKGGVIAMPLGKVSFSNDQLLENFNSALDAVIRAKPTSAKGRYLVTLTMSTTMGPGIPVDVAAATKTAGH
jgi:large subunit ribosomal protein L1